MHPPPPPPAEIRKLEWAPETAIRFNNSAGAPLSITSATVKAARIEGPSRDDSDPNSEERYLIKLAVQLVNNTARRISVVAIEYPSGESRVWMRTYSSVKIEPHESYNLESPHPSAPGYGALFLRGNPDRMEARVMGVKFEDGEVWGALIHHGFNTLKRDLPAVRCRREIDHPQIQEVRAQERLRAQCAAEQSRS